MNNENQENIPPEVINYYCVHQECQKLLIVICDHPYVCYSRQSVKLCICSNCQQHYVIVRVPFSYNILEDMYLRADTLISAMELYDELVNEEDDEEENNSSSDVDYSDC